MNDGLYKIIRGRDMTLGPEKVLVCSAYNNRESFTFRNRGYRVLPFNGFLNTADYLRKISNGFNAALMAATPTSLDHASTLYIYLQRGFAIAANSIFGRDNEAAYAGTSLGEIDPLPRSTSNPAPYGYYYTESNDAEALFGFTTPALAGTITKISVYALVKGSAKTKFRNLAGTITYGTTESSIDIYRWIYTDYSAAWNWSDINSIKAGVWLDCDSGICRSIKLRIWLSDGSYVDIYPTSDYSNSYIRRIYGNPFQDSDDGAVLYYDASFHYDEKYHTDIGLSRIYASNLSSFPPSYSQINKIKVYFSWAGWDHYTEQVLYDYYEVFHDNWYADGEAGCTIKPYLLIDGTRYYGTEYSIGSNIDALIEHNQEWATNPATGLAWTYHEAQGICFGLQVSRPNTNSFGTCRIYQLYAEIYYNEIAGNTIEYQALNPVEDSIILTQYTQSPIQADDLSFAILSPIPERTELCLIEQGRMVWRGLVWVADENKNKSEFNISAKSQQVLLDYRIFPGINYFPRNNGFDGQVYDIDDLLSDDCPTFPVWYYIQGDEDHPRSYRSEDLAATTVHVFDVFSHRIHCEDPNVGLFFFLNSWQPDPSTWNATMDNAVFSYDSLPRNQNEDTFDKGAGALYPGYPGVYNPAPIHVLTSEQSKGCLYRLNWRSNPANVGRGEFSITGSTLTTQSPEGSTCVLVDHAMDTHIRPGTNDLGDRLLNVLYDWRGVASVLFSDFFKKMGQEVRYRYEMDGNVYQDSAVEIANGSAENPLRKFVHNQSNCRIVKRIPSEPPYNAAIGLGNNPKVASNWAKARTWISKVFSNTQTADDLQDYLDEKLDADDTIYDITITGDEIWLLRPGDYISVQAENDGPVSVRIRQITTRHQRTIIRAGARLSSVNEQFGIWRDTKAAPREDNKIRSQEIAAVTGLTQSQAFTIYADDVKRDRWACKAKVGWDVELVSPVYVDSGAPTTPKTEQFIRLYRWPSFVGDPITTEATLSVSGIYTGFGITKIEVKGSKEWNHAIEDYSIQYLIRFDGGSWEGPYTANSTPTTVDIGHGLSATAQTFDDYNTVSRIAVYDHIHGAIYVCQTFDVSSFDKFLKLSLNGKAIPPGRYLALGDSGSMEVDITEFCNTSPTSDTTNTLAVQLVGALALGTNFNYYHYLAKGSIDQYKRFLPLEEVL